MKASSLALATAVLVIALTPAPVHTAEERKTVTFKEVAPPYPSRHPPLNEQRTARPGDTVYTERSTGLPGARLAQKLTLKNTPAGRVTLDPDNDLNKYLVDGAPYFCAAHSLKPRRRIRMEAGFYICLRDSDGDAQTFEEVRIITMVLTVLDKERSLDEVKVKFRRTHEDTMSGTLSPKAFTQTTTDPDDGRYYEAAVALTGVANGAATFQARLVDSDGNTEFEGDPVSVALSGPLPRTVSIPHPFEGDTVYLLGMADKEEEEKRRDRAAHIEILGTEGGGVTYRVVRSFSPWRFWVDGYGRKAQRRMRWRPRP